MTEKHYIYRYFKIALLFFLVSGTYGWLMRLQRVVSLPHFTYGSYLQAHSHVTFLGWGFLSVTSLLVYVFVPELIKKKTIQYSFWIMIVTLIGMLISFPVQGYKLFSILFLSIYLMTSYVYLAVIYRGLKTKQSQSVSFVKTGILYYYLSSLAIWVIPVISLKIGKGELYHSAIGFYTHFLYNGFFVLVLFGLFVQYLYNNKEMEVNSVVVKKFYLLTNFAVIPSFFLVLLQNETYSSLAVVASFIGVIFQLLSLVFLGRLTRHFHQLIVGKKIYIGVFHTVISAYFIKEVLQFFSAFPWLTKQAILLSQYLVIGYIHLFTLAFMSLFLILFFVLFTENKLSKLGVVSLMSGVILTESWLFINGALLYFNVGFLSDYFNLFMLIFSTLLVLGIWVLWSRLKQRISL